MLYNNEVALRADFRIPLNSFEILLYIIYSTLCVYLFHICVHEPMLRRNIINHTIGILLSFDI